METITQVTAPVLPQSSKVRFDEAVSRVVYQCVDPVAGVCTKWVWCDAGHNITHTYKYTHPVTGVKSKVVVEEVDTLSAVTIAVQGEIDIVDEIVATVVIDSNSGGTEEDTGVVLVDDVDTPVVVVEDDSTETKIAMIRGVVIVDEVDIKGIETAMGSVESTVKEGADRGGIEVSREEELQDPDNEEGTEVEQGPKPPHDGYTRKPPVKKWVDTVEAVGIRQPGQHAHKNRLGRMRKTRDSKQGTRGRN